VRRQLPFICGAEGSAGTDDPLFLEAHLAQPPDMSDTFVREVDENLRRDRARDFVRDNAGLLIGAMVLFLAACGGLIYWHQYRGHRVESQVEQLAQVNVRLDAGNTSGAPQQLGDLAKSSSDAVRGSAMFGLASLALRQGDSKQALARYRDIAADSGLPDSFRNLALIRQTALEFDSMAPQAVVARLQPLATPNSPWFGSAGELTAVALAKEGKRDEAGRLFAELARDKDVPDGIRARSIQMASTFGIDASAAIPSAPAL
jgi:hypothetical protein